MVQLIVLCKPSVMFVSALKLRETNDFIIDAYLLPELSHGRLGRCSKPALFPVISFIKVANSKIDVSLPLPKL